MILPGRPTGGSRRDVGEREPLVLRLADLAQELVAEQRVDRAGLPLEVVDAVVAQETCARTGACVVAHEPHRMPRA